MLSYRVRSRSLQSKGGQRRVRYSKNPYLLSARIDLGEEDKPRIVLAVRPGREGKVAYPFKHTQHSVHRAKVEDTIDWGKRSLSLVTQTIKSSKLTHEVGLEQ